MIDNSYDYWFSKYDSESFDKDFLKVPYNEFLNQLISNPDFNQLPSEPLLSHDSGHKTLQLTLQQNHQIISTYFLPLLENSRENFLRWVRCVIAYLDCEKMYSIMFWNLTFVPNFLEYRLYASFIRFYKFLLSLTQNVIQSKSQTNDQTQTQTLLTIKQYAERYHDSLYLNFEELKKLQRQMLKVLKPLVSQNPTLIGKIYYFIYHMYDKPMQQLRRDLDLQFGLLEYQWVQQILNENQLAIKFIDAYLNEDKQRLSNKDQFLFENSQVLQKLTTQKKTEQLYKIDTQDKSLLDKSKKIQFLNQIESQCKQKHRDQKSSVFVQNFTAFDSMKSASENKSLKYSNDDISKSKTNSQTSNQVTQWESSFIQNSINNPQNVQNSTLSFLASDLIYIEKIHKEEKCTSTLPKRKPQDPVQLDDDLVEFISKADNKIVAIRDEDITFDDNFKKKRYRIKINKRLEENESPDNNRKMTLASMSQQENNDDELRRIRARRLLEEQNEKLRYAVNQDNELATVKDKDLFRYSFEDSMSEDDELDEDMIIQQKVLKEAKVFVPKNYSQNTQGIIFEKFKQLQGDQIYGGPVKKKLFLYRLFHMDENSFRINVVNGQIDFEGRYWELLKYLQKTQKLTKENNFNLQLDDTNQIIQHRAFNYKKKQQNCYNKFYNF